MKYWHDRQLREEARIQLAVKGLVERITNVENRLYDILVQEEKEQLKQAKEALEKILRP